MSGRKNRLTKRWTIRDAGDNRHGQHPETTANASGTRFSLQPVGGVRCAPVVQVMPCDHGSVDRSGSPTSAWPWIADHPEKRAVSISSLSTWTPKVRRRLYFEGVIFAYVGNGNFDLDHVRLVLPGNHRAQ